MKRTNMYLLVTLSINKQVERLTKELKGIQDSLLEKKLRLIHEIHIFLHCIKSCEDLECLD